MTRRWMWINGLFLMISRHELPWHWEGSEAFEEKGDVQLGHY